MNQRRLARKTFAVSRMSEFTTQAELTKQIGHSIVDWPEVAVKELVDNAIDDSEEGGLPPKVEVVVDTAARTITVTDSGRGIPAATVKALCDLSMRVSSRAAYVAPTRGQQGNALQTILAMPCALDRNAPGHVTIDAKGIEHRIAFEVDPLREIPYPRYERHPSLVKNGTRVELRWPDRACSLLQNSKARFLQTARAFVCFNPHLELTATWDEERLVRAAESDADWRRWSPSDPTSVHWYDLDHFRRLMAAIIIDAEDRRERVPLVREFITEFHGLSATAKGKAVLDAVDAHGMSLRDLHADPRRVGALLESMQVHAEPVKPRRLGAVGREHLMGWAEAHGANPHTFAYGRREIEDRGIPYVVEVAFAYGPELGRRLDVTGINFSPVIGGRPFGEYDEIFADQHIGPASPVIVFVHATGPRFDFTDKGKSSVDLPPVLSGALIDLLIAVTKGWRKQWEREIRDARARLRREEMLDRERRKHRLTLKEAVFRVMEAAYLVASASGTLPANARQIFYVARRLIQSLVEPGTVLVSQYFTQTLLPDYIEEHSPDWEPAYDARGHFVEPHTNRTSGLGTLDVEAYLKRLARPEVVPVSLARARIKTCGPSGRFGGVLFIEKEGFMPLIEAAEIAKRHDLLITSSKGFSVVAVRRLIDELCGRRGLPLYILHDFDISGFGIAKTLINDSRRYRFRHQIKNVVDLGLRLFDIASLPDEEVSIGKNYAAIVARLKTNGATEEEIAYLLCGPLHAGIIDSGRRVELNALTSDQFVAFVERKLNAAGARKVVPDGETMTAAFTAFKRDVIARPVIERWLERHARCAVVVPADLEVRVRAYLAKHPAQPWESAVRSIAGTEDDEDEEDE